LDSHCCGCCAPSAGVVPSIFSCLCSSCSLELPYFMRRRYATSTCSFSCLPLGDGGRKSPANFGVRYLHGGRDLYAACSTPQDGAGRTIAVIQSSENHRDWGAWLDHMGARHLQFMNVLTVENTHMALAAMRAGLGTPSLNSSCSRRKSTQAALSCLLRRGSWARRRSGCIVRGAALHCRGSLRSENGSWRKRRGAHCHSRARQARTRPHLLPRKRATTISSQIRELCANLMPRMPA
jgi:hypothetical protein